MARLKSASGVKLLVLVDQGGPSPEALCTINAQRGISFTNQMGESLDIDCADPTAVAFVLREKVSRSVSVTGQGTFETTDGQILFDWWSDDDTKTCRIVVDVASADGGLVFEGEFHLTDFEISGNRGEKMQATLTLMSSGEVTATANT